MATSILENCTPMITGEEAKKSVEIIFGIYESARTGKEVVLEQRLILQLILEAQQNEIYTWN